MTLNRSDAVGWQEKKLGELLSESDLLSGNEDEELLDHEWLGEKPVDVRNKLYEIFLERSSVLFSQTEHSNSLMLWIKHTVGFLLNKIEAGEVSTHDREGLLAKIASIVEMPKELKLDRYMDLKVADFTDNITTINPDELLGIAPQVQPHQDDPDQPMANDPNEQENN